MCRIWMFVLPGDDDVLLAGEVDQAVCAQLPTVLVYPNLGTTMLIETSINGTVLRFACESRKPFTAQVYGSLVYMVLSVQSKKGKGERIKDKIALKPG